MSEKIVQTAGWDQLGTIAPLFAHLNDDVLFGEVWNDESIDLKTRCIVTVVTLMGSGITDGSMKYHLMNAKNNGVSRDEIVGIVTHAAMYAGWPKAWAVFNLVKEVWGQEGAPLSEKDRYQKTIVFPIGSPNDAFAQYFKGQSYISVVSEDKLNIHNVTFEPGCRNNWHMHKAKSGGGQVLVCVGGRGFFQEEGKDAVRMLPGTVVNIPVDVKHWHGAASDSWFSHLAIELPGEETENEWFDAVSDEDYLKAQEAPAEDAGKEKNKKKKK